ncbi:hypothetical protein D3C72_1392910 [compost metagenome]
MGRGAALIVPEGAADTHLRLGQLHVSPKVQAVVLEAAAHQSACRARAAAQGVIRGRQAPPAGVIAQHHRPFAACLAVSGIFSRAVGSRRVLACIDRVPPQTVGGSDCQAAESPFVGDRIVGAGIGAVAVQRVGAVDIWPEDIRIQCRPEGHRPLPAEGELPPAIAQPDKGLPTKQSATLVR